MSPRAKGHLQLSRCPLSALSASRGTAAEPAPERTEWEGQTTAVGTGRGCELGAPSRWENHLPLNSHPGTSPARRAAWQGLGRPVGRGGGWRPGGPCPGPSACLSHRGVGSSRSQDNAQGLQARSAQGGSSGGHEHKKAEKGKTATATTAKASEEPKTTAKFLTRCDQPSNAGKPSTAGRGGRTQRGAGKSNQGEEE